MGRWFHLSVGLGLLAVLLTCSHADENHCLAARDKTCTKCLQTGVDCSYCRDEDYVGSRCDLHSNLILRGCSVKGMVKSQGRMQIEREIGINERLAQSQVSPQQVKMDLRPGQVEWLDVEVFAPNKGPLDLYILMDFSYSMNDDLTNLKNMGEKLASFVKEHSDDPVIGFGKFVDKVVEPQTDMKPLKLKHPWADSDSPFGFKNVIKLTSKVDYFIQELNKEKISGNLDAPEGGFDAILQAAVCTEEIGWRNESIHLLVFSTESAFHYEADGTNVLSGILPRNDELCHLEMRDGALTYIMDTTQDYPSIPTLVRLLGKHNIIPIFAVTEHSYDHYQRLKEFFPIAEIGKLEENSANILEIIGNAFKSIRSKTSVRAEERPKAFATEFRDTAGHVKEYGQFNFEPGKTGKFKLRVEAERMINGVPVCEGSLDEKEGTMRVKPTTFNAAVNIEATVVCPICDCDKTGMVKRADRCNNKGDLVCGKCQCFPGNTGPFCNCSYSGGKIDDRQCIGPKQTQPCGGRGDCTECGTCACYNPEQFEGDYCQFDKTQCSRYGGFLCNEQGACTMGRCACKKGWEGEACGCPISTSTCLDSKGGICGGIGKCECGACVCPSGAFDLNEFCLPNFEARSGACEGTRICVQCKAWKTGEGKEDCDECEFQIEMVDELKDPKTVLDSCSFRDDEDDCTYHYTVDKAKNAAAQAFEVQVLKKKDCPAASLLWLLPLLLFLLLLLALLLLCCWKYCGCCKTCFQRCLGMLPCCNKGRMVGFKEDEYMFRQSLLTSDHVDTPMVRTGPPKGTDVVRWKVTDNVHRGPNHPQALIKPNPKDIIQYPISLRLFPENLSRSDTREAEILRKKITDNLSEVYKQIPGAQKVQNPSLRMQSNAGKRQNFPIVDTVLSAPRGSYPDIVKLTEKNVQSGNFRDLKVVPGYYTVATDREAAGAVEFQEGVELIDVHVPLFVKDEDDDKKKLLVEAVDVPLGIAELGKRLVNITVIKDSATTIFSFLQPAYTYNRSDGVVPIPVSREIIEDGNAKVTYRTRDLTAKDQKDYEIAEGDLSYGPGETQKDVPVRLLELEDKDGLLDKQVKQFVMDLSNPRQGGRLGRYPRTTVTISDQPATQIGYVQTTATSPGGRPVAPGNPDAKATGPNSIRLKWNHIDKATGYKVKYWIFGDPEKDAKVMDVKTNQADLTNLYAYCDYEMRVCAHNAMGDGPYTEMVECQTLEDVPGEPGRLAFNVISPTVTQVSWAEPAETNGPLTAYEVVYTPIDDDKKPVGAPKKVKIDNPKKRMLLIENLKTAQTYQYQVRAKNSVGWGPFRDATINLAAQPARPLSIPIIPDIPIVDAEAGEGYDSYLMYSNEVLKSPAGSKTPSVSGDGWKFLKMVGSDLDLRKVSWKKRDDIIPRRLSTDTETSSDDVPRPGHAHTHLPDYTMNGKWDQNFLFPGGSGTRNLSASSSPMSTLSSNYPGGSYPGGSYPGGSYTTETHTTYMSGPGASYRQDMIGGGLHSKQVIMRKRSENRGYTDENIRDSIVMGDLSSKFSDQGGFSYTGMQSSSQSQFSYGLSQGSLPRTPSDVNDALYDLDRVLQDVRQSQGVPDTPSRLVFSALGPTALKVSWQEPHCEKSILGYCVTYQQLNGGEAKRVNVTNPAENSVIIQELLPNHSYLFKVMAQSQEGWGPEREGVITIESAVDPKSPLCPMPGSPFTLSTPSAPGPLVFTALSSDSLQLSWEKPRKPNGDILGYVVTCEQLHGGGDVRTFQVNNNAETSLTVPNLTENVPYKFKVQARTMQGFGPEREGIITIESQDAGSMSQYNSQSMGRMDVFQLPTDVSTRTNVSHTMINDPFYSGDGMMMTTQHMESSGMVTRQITKEVVQRSVVGGTSVTKKMLYES